jgi:hypothetical protein
VDSDAEGKKMLFKVFSFLKAEPNKKIFLSLLSTLERCGQSAITYEVFAR